MGRTFDTVVIDPSKVRLIYNCLKVLYIQYHILQKLCMTRHMLCFTANTDFIEIKYTLYPASYTHFQDHILVYVGTHQTMDTESVWTVLEPFLCGPPYY